MGWLSNVFGGGDPSQPKDAVFLDADEAKSMGDTEYMRTAKLVKRTFPKTVSQPEDKTTVKQVSAMKAQDAQQPQVGRSSFTFPTFSQPVTPTADPQATPPASSPAPAAPIDFSATENRRKTDTSMDMFRNMAKDIRK